jgi:hypothetical protein
LSSAARLAVAPNLALAHAAAIERDYLLPFAATRGISAPELASLRRRALDLCRVLGRQRARILPPEDLDNAALAALAENALKEDLSSLLLERSAAVLPDLDEEVRALLTHRGLLGDALLWFLRERLRTDPQVCATLDALQREGIWSDLRALKMA